MVHRSPNYRDSQTNGSHRDAISIDDIRDNIASKMGFLRLKRAIDVAITLVAAPAILIVVGLACLMVLITSGRPVLYSQNRVGLNGRPFRILKIRTMAPTTKVFMHATLEGDPRIIAGGQFLRDTHIDELPQFWNIFKGDMSIIGPRPEQVHLVEEYRKEIPLYELRHLVRAGLSGWSQLQYGYAADLDQTRRKFEYDFYYVCSLGPKIDFKVAIGTLLRVGGTVQA